MARKTILLVEDDRDEAYLMLRALEKNNFAGQAVVIRNGSEALDYLFLENEYADRDPHELPDLILLDINLPKLNGLEVLRRLRADPRTRLLPIVILTSSEQERDLAEAYQSGANSYVVKSIDFQEFVEAVGQLSAYWLELNRIPPHQTKTDK